MTISSIGRVAAALLIVCAGTGGLLLSYGSWANIHAQEPAILNLAAEKRDDSVIALAVGVEGSSSEGVFDAGNLQKTITALTQATSIEFLDNPLLDAIGAFERRTKVTFRVDLKDATEKTVTYETDNQPLGRALQVMLDTCNCEYSILPDGAIRIMSKVEKDK